MEIRRKMAAALLAGAVGGAAGLYLVPSVHQSIGPAAISSRSHPGNGQTVLRFPPLGTVVARTHHAPITLEVSLTSVDVPSLAGAFERTDARRTLTAQLENGLRSAAQRLLFQMAVIAALAGAAAAVIVVSRTWGTALLGAAGATILVAVAAVWIGITFDVEAFEEPRFTGALERAPVVIEAVQRGEVTLTDVRNRYHRGADRLAELLALVAEPLHGPGTATTAILHISDVHSNPLGLELAARLVDLFEIDAVVDTGDLTNFGVTFEAELGRFISALPVPYYLVPGNHDSAANQRILDRIDNVTVLERDVVEVNGISILGWRDPTYSNWNNIPNAEADAIRIEEGDSVALEVARVQPDVLAVHDARMAQASIGSVPLVLAGHDHKQDYAEEDGTVILKVGTTGAAGFKFFVEAERDYEAQIVYFDGPRATAVDYIRLRALGSEFEVQRRTIPAIQPAPDEGAAPGRTGRSATISRT